MEGAAGCQDTHQSSAGWYTATSRVADALLDQAPTCPPRRLRPGLPRSPGEKDRPGQTMKRFLRPPHRACSPAPCRLLHSDPLTLPLPLPARRQLSDASAARSTSKAARRRRQRRAAREGLRRPPDALVPSKCPCWATRKTSRGYCGTRALRLRTADRVPARTTALLHPAATRSSSLATRWRHLQHRQGLRLPR